METLNVRLTEERGAEGVRRRVKFDSEEIWWAFDGPADALPAPMATHDMAAVAMIFRAMWEGRNLHVDGPVSLPLLEGLEEFVTCWVLWRPDLYRRITVSASEELAPSLAPERRDLAVAAYSGGVDSAFTIWRHHRQDAGRRSRSLHCAAFIHGFDIPLQQNAAYDVAFSRASETLRSIGVPLVRLTTNWRLVGCRSWQMDFGAGLTACLRNWEGSVGSALIGSGEDYAHLAIPWGSNPVSLPMFSTPSFEIIYHGLGFTRTEKAAALSDWPEAVSNLRVCWLDVETGKNCGSCEKCIRTKLNFMAAGLPLPESLAEPPTPRQIRQINARNRVQLELLEDILNFAKNRGAQEYWIDPLKVAVKRSRRRMAIRQRGIRLRQLLPMSVKQILPKSLKQNLNAAFEAMF
ncbi:hypothetical protein SAZ10_31525 [Mesorhizobium sp. BAC0120]|uniref:hypothetical protein n=1 Tax=Mesorhizobium sp. BAC0120 TaxID=3090670 RepID=UPI00298C0790|nr:hypothetical protein [Mesorhizobium sp. BAC0120]MDW6026299.1 hypothetical protein [Mesorhizobium sp. BAC0120]